MGNFDHKNICVQIEVRENLTDARMIEFVKDWNFTIEDFQSYLKSLNGTLSTEKAEAMVRFFIEYQDGILLPDRCGVHEPLRYNFDKDKVSTYVDWISFPAGCLMLKKKRKFDVEIGNRFWGVIWLDGELLVPKRVLPEYLGRITFWFAKQRKVDMDFLKQLLRDFCSYLNTDVGYIFDQENMTVLFDLFYPERVGTKIDTWD